ncbi:MAG: hypothetical protein NT002_10035 [candidate division Zixibacteria bacterium]|nr:hypothetical protein [candidate division Zixibacteria bacterium]
MKIVTKIDALVVVATLVCGFSYGQSSYHENASIIDSGHTMADSISTRPFMKSVARMKQLPQETRLVSYLKLAQTLDPSPKLKPSEDSTSLYCFSRELFLQREDSALKYLERSISDMDAKKAIWMAVARTPGDRADRLLQAWSITHPEAVELMKYHPDAQELLLRVVEDRRAPAERRAMSARILADMRNIDVLPRLMRFINDSTPVIEVSAEKAKTLGDVISECVDRLKTIK